MKNKYYYRIPDECEDSYYPFETNWDAGKEHNQALEDAAESLFHSECEERKWPLELSLHESEGGEELHRATVEIEIVLVFNCID